MLRLVLWDVDHTLIENAGVSKEIYAAAFTALTGRTPSHLAPTEGRTDPDIMAELLRIHEAPPFPWPQVERALEAAGAAHRGALAERGTVLPGVVDMITALAALPRVVQTIVTGNIRANAEVKVAALGLLGWLDLDVGSSAIRLAISRPPAVPARGSSRLRLASTQSASCARQGQRV